MCSPRLYNLTRKTFSSRFLRCWEATTTSSIEKKSGRTQAQEKNQSLKSEKRGKISRVPKFLRIFTFLLLGFHVTTSPNHCWLKDEQLSALSIDKLSPFHFSHSLARCLVEFSTLFSNFMHFMYLFSHGKTAIGDWFWMELKSKWASMKEKKSRKVWIFLLLESAHDWKIRRSRIRRGEKFVYRRADETFSAFRYRVERVSRVEVERVGGGKSKLHRIRRAFHSLFMTYYTPTRLVVSLGKMSTAVNSHPSNVYDNANGELFVGILVILSSVVREIKEKNGIQLDITVASEWTWRILRMFITAVGGLSGIQQTLVV